MPAALRPGVAIAERLQAHGWEAYLVGGVVRDLLLGRTPADLDIVTAAPPQAVAALFDRTVPVGAEFGVVAVILDGRQFQVATFRREGPYLDGRRPAFVEPADAAADALRRDFTINALFYDPVSHTILDYVGGREDLDRRCIRTVGDPTVRFGEDRLRMLRAVRLGAELGFAIDPAALEAMTDLSATVRTVSAERIHEELARLLVAPGRAQALRLLAHTGLLGAILPELVPAGGGARSPGGDLGTDRLARSLRALGHLRRPSAVVAMAVLLLAVERPDQADAVCRRLRFSNVERRAITALVREHARVADLAAMRPGAVRALFARAAPADLLEVYRVAALAAGRDSSAYVRAAEIVAAQVGSLGLPRPLLSGRDLVALGLSPGPQFASILESVEEARMRGEVATRQDARAWVRARLPAGAPPQAGEPVPAPKVSGARGGEHD
ncbi:MAG: CCA tRNA nucleotidyltransferase [Armatimonadota bacterium]|nr:CCA tRNA nucleotidyltransferase [Armatimonadota bacterium]